MSTELLNTLRTSGRSIVLEGVPCVGKTGLLHAFAATLRGAGIPKVCEHVEDRTDGLLDAKNKNPSNNAGWFQLYKLVTRQLTLAKIDASLREDPSTVHLVDRSLAGDYSFFLYDEKDMDPALAAGYRDQLEKWPQLSDLRPPLVVIYLTARVEVLLQRVAKRGIAWEMEKYDAKYYRDMDAAHRRALAELGVQYVELDWSEHHEDGVVPSQRCMEILANALKAGNCRKD